MFQNCTHTETCTAPPQAKRFVSLAFTMNIRIILIILVYIAVLTAVSIELNV